MTAKDFRTIAVFAWILAALTGTAWAGDPSPGEEIVHASLASFCPDLAETAEFREAGLGYVHSVEFARSVFAVANGTSKHSPREIPPEWRAAAYGWWTHVAADAGAGIRFTLEGGDASVEGPRGVSDTARLRPRIRTTIGRSIDYDRESLTAESCDPALLRYASLDYRDRIGARNLPVVGPGRVRPAAESLDRKIRSKYAEANRLAAQADRIRRRIADSERLGAAFCQPQELARVKADYETAVEIAVDIDRTLAEAEAALARAEESSAELLARRQFASSRGIPCLHAK
ncbi:MAG: hypothetical protein Kow00128_20580 [Deltaproteobacteria bacterium]